MWMGKYPPQEVFVTFGTVIKNDPYIHPFPPRGGRPRAMVRWMFVRCARRCVRTGGFLARFTEQSPLIIGKCLHLISSPDWKTNYSAMRLPKAKQEQAGATTSRYLCKWVCPNRSSACLRFAYWCVCMCILYPVPSQMETSDVWAEGVFKPNRGSSVALYRAYQKTPEAETDIDSYSSDGARANERVWINSTSN